MQKIVTLFQRNYDGDRLVRNEVVPGTEWVFTGEGRATVKLDGTCCLVRDGKLFKRYELKAGKAAPQGFEAAQRPDPVTGDTPGWLPAGDGPDDRWHREAWEATAGLEDGTYELMGPKIQGNPDGLAAHALIRHGEQTIDAPRDFDGLKAFLEPLTIEGIVWHHPDGRMVKIKRRDFFKGRR